MLKDELIAVSRVSTFLENFTHKSTHLWNCSCPICGDFSKGRKKARFYIYKHPAGDTLNVRCHHCGFSSRLMSFIKFKFPDIFSEFVFAKYKNDTTVSLESIFGVATPTPGNEDRTIKNNLLDGLINCRILSDNHPANIFLESRKIPLEKRELFYYTDEIKRFINSVEPGKFKSYHNDHPRIVLPYYDESGNVFALAARSLSANKGTNEPKYYTIKFDKTKTSIFGLERLRADYSPIFAVEGPIDSLFLHNCIAVSGSSFDCEFLRKHKDRAILIWDNEPRSKEIVKLMYHHILLGYYVCMMPHKTLVGKDINEYFLNDPNLKSSDLETLIRKNTYRGIPALLHLKFWHQSTFDFGARTFNNISTSKTNKERYAKKSFTPDPLLY